MESLDRHVDLLAEVWAWWADVLSSIEKDAPAWRRPTRLEPWDVAALVAHHSLLVQGLAFLPGTAAGAPASPETPSAEAMLRRFNQPDGIAITAAGQVAEMARQVAAAHAPSALVARFRDAAPATLARVRAAGPVVVNYFGFGTFPLEEAVRIAMLEGVVHGLDLREALPAPVAQLPANGLTATARLLASIADAEQFIEAATGRSPDSVFPVIR